MNIHHVLQTCTMITGGGGIPPLPAHAQTVDTRPYLFSSIGLGTRLTSSIHGRQPRRRTPVSDILVWTECYALMAAVLTEKFPSFSPQLFAYMRRVVHAARNFRGTAWVAYDRLYRRQAAARRSLDWALEDSAPTTRHLWDRRSLLQDASIALVRTMQQKPVKSLIRLIRPTYRRHRSCSIRFRR